MNLAVDTLIDEVEPCLLRSELVIRTPRGRKVTPGGYDHLGLSPADLKALGAQRTLFE
jgi:Holliday junction DNA helicase RuvB